MMPRADDAATVQYAFDQRAAIVATLGAGRTDSISDPSYQDLDACSGYLPHAPRLQLDQARDAHLRHDAPQPIGNDGVASSQRGRSRAYARLPHPASFTAE